MNAYGYIEKRKLSGDNLRNLCISKNWYTCGDGKEYNHLLYILADKKDNITSDDIFKIASDILSHSKTEYDFENVCFLIASTCVSIFERI
ncbi:MAG: hypothetical protein WCD89_04055 [Anaerocolumna sp.]